MHLDLRGDVSVGDFNSELTLHPEIDVQHVCRNGAELAQGVGVQDLWHIRLKGHQ